VMVTAMAGLVIAAAIGLAIDGRELAHESIWAKPLKFGVSFVVYGLTLAWLLPWWLVVRALPKGATRADRPADPPYSALLRHKALWLAGVCHAATNYSFFFVSIWLPLYLVNTRGFSIGSMTVLVAAVFAVQAASSLVVGQLADRLVRAGHTQDVVLRRLSAGGLVAVTAGIAGVALAPGQAALAGWLLFTGVALGIGPVTVFAMGQTFAGPRLSGSWIGWQSAIGSLSGAVGPVVTGAIVDATGGYAGAFAFAGAVSLLGAGLFLWVLPTIRPVLAD